MYTGYTKCTLNLCKIVFYLQRQLIDFPTIKIFSVSLFNAPYNQLVNCVNNRKTHVGANHVVQFCWLYDVIE